MKSKKWLGLAIALLMFPQIAQTLYSPALADISRTFAVGPQQVAHTLSVYFLSFAFGVVVWGRLCDRIGRCPSMLAGLLLYAAASILALISRTFDVLLVAQVLAAFGVAVCSVVTQTLLRDCFSGAELAQVFSLAGIALAASPAIGLFGGASLVQAFGYRGVLWCLLLLSLGLGLWSWRALPETLSRHLAAIGLFETLWRMVRDLDIWHSALLVAFFNITLFSYYSLAPFMFEKLGLSGQLFGCSGVILALGAGLGAWLNKRLLRSGFTRAQLIRVAALSGLLGGVGVWLLQDSVRFVLAMLLVVLGFGVAIPNILSSALSSYGDRLGTAGALLGLLYYLLMGGGMILVARSQALGLTLVVFGVLELLLAMRPSRAGRA